MPALQSLQTIQLDALRETANIGAAHAATALSEMTGATIMIKVPAIQIIRIDGLVSQFSADEEPVAAVLMSMLGDMTGRTLLVFPHHTVQRLTELMLRRPATEGAPLTEMEQSAIKEAGNILSGAYLNALSEFLGMILLPSPPSLAIDMSEAVLSSAYLQFAEDPDAILCIESEFILTQTEQTLRGLFVLMPDPSSLQSMLRALRLA
jgi:chemotaxis protein CheC